MTTDQSTRQADGNEALYVSEVLLLCSLAQSSDLIAVLRKSRTEPLLLSTVCADPRSISVEQGTIAGLILQILSARLAMVTGPHRAVHVCEKHIEERQRQDVIWQRHAELSIPDHSPCCFGL